MHDRETRLRAQRLIEEGQSVSEVARRLGVSRAAVRDWRDAGPSALRGRGSPCPATTGPADPARYAELFGFYLGDGHLSRMGRTWRLRISCDERYPGLTEGVAQLLDDIRPSGAPALWVPAPGCVVVQAYWNHWPCLFPQHGPGRKPWVE